MRARLTKLEFRCAALLALAIVGGCEDERERAEPDAATDAGRDSGIGSRPRPMACVDAAPASQYAFALAPQLDVDERGNAVVWWQAKPDRGTNLPELAQLVLWDGSAFSSAGEIGSHLQRQELEGPEQVAALVGGGSWLRAVRREMEITLHTSDCMASSRELGAGNGAFSLSLAANHRGVAVLAWRNSFPSGVLALRLTSDDLGSEPQLIEPSSQSPLTIDPGEPRVAVDAEGRAILALRSTQFFADVEPRATVHVSRSNGGDFGPPERVFASDSSPDVLPELAISPAGHALLVAREGPPVNQPPPPRPLQIAHYSPHGGWRELAEHPCAVSRCAPRFGIDDAGRGWLVLAEEGKLRAFAVRDAGTSMSWEVELDAPLLAHTVDVAPDGSALVVWLTPSGIRAVRHSPRSGWSKPVLLHALALELPQFLRAYVIEARRLPDGRSLIAWMQYDEVRWRFETDVRYLDAFASSVWALVVDGSDVQAQRLSGAQMSQR